MGRYRLVVEIDDDDRDQVESKPWTATASCDGRGVTVAAGLGETPWEALADLEVHFEAIEVTG